MTAAAVAGDGDPLMLALDPIYYLGHMIADGYAVSAFSGPKHKLTSE